MQAPATGLHAVELELEASGSSSDCPDHATASTREHAQPDHGAGNTQESDTSSIATTPPQATWTGRSISAKPDDSKLTQARRCLFRARRYLFRVLRKVPLLVKVLGVGSMLLVLLVSLFGEPGLLISDEVAHRRTISLLFLIGLFLVAVEDVVGINKSAVMLILAATMWVFTAARFHPTVSEEGHEEFHRHLNKGLTDVGGIVLFLLPAMAVVESIDHFGGFNVVTVMINCLMGSRRDRLMPIICLLAFFMSSVIDNLTATIVCLKILRHVAADDEAWRQLCGGLVVIAANAGGAWSPIGDVTTTMLWIQNKISVSKTVAGLFLPSLVAGVVPLGGLWWQARCGERKLAAKSDADWDGQEAGAETAEVTRSSVMVLLLGTCSILAVPVLKMATGLPPFLGMLFALGVVWIATESMDFVAPPSEAASEEAGEEDPELATETTAEALERKPGQQPGPAVHGGVPEALHKVDLTGLLFFTGVLLAVVALDSAGVLRRYATWMKEAFGDSPVTLCSLLGASSAVVDNVPLVEASIEMFDNPVDDPLWQLVALAAGTGGSILSIGSIAGVTLMSMEGVGFLWYVRKVSLWAAVGFAAGIATYEAQRRLIG